MKSAFFALALFAAGTLPLAGAGAAEPDPAKGHAFAKTFCSRCHSVEPTGASPMAEAPPFRTLPSRFPPEDLGEALAEGIKVGHEAMPEFVLEPDQIDDFIAYLKLLGED